MAIIKCFCWKKQTRNIVNQMYIYLQNLDFPRDSDLRQVSFVFLNISHGGK